MYKDKDKQKEADKERQRRYRSRKHGATINNKQGCIYLIRCVGFPYYKIGVSEGKAIDRLNALQTGVPFELELIKAVSISDIGRAERYMHSLYKAKNVRGEWFNFTDNELVDVIAKYEHLSLFYRMIA